MEDDQLKDTVSYIVYGAFIGTILSPFIVAGIVLLVIVFG